MTRRAQTIIGVIALALALLSGGGVYWFLGTFAATAMLPVPNQPIPAGALITAALLTEREAPRALLHEPLYTDAADLVGQVAQVPLAAGQLVYRQHAVALRDYRLVDDPALVVVSVPVEPARAVGGQVQPGQRVDLWTLPLVRNRQTETVLTATLVLSDVLVVDVRASQGQATTRQPQAVPEQLAAQPTAQATPQSQQQTVPLQILTVALPVTQTTVLLDAVAAVENGAATLWVAFAPLARPAPQLSQAAVPPGFTLEVMPSTATVTATASLPLTATPILTVTTTPAPVWRVVKTGGMLQVRETPGGAVVGALPEGALVYQLAGPEDLDSMRWYRVTQHGDQAVSGWVAGAYLEAVQP